MDVLIFLQKNVGFVRLAIVFFASFLLVGLMSVAIAATGVNKQIPFTATLKDSSGNAVTDGDYDIVFKIYDAASGGNTLWTGTHTTANSNAVSVTDGIFRVMLGSGSGNTLDLDFNDDTYYLGLTVEADSEMTPRQRLGASGYAINSDQVDGLDATAFLRSNATTSLATSSADTLLTIIQSGGGDILNIFDGANPSLVVRDGGNVGIGTSTPGRTLTVAGDLYLTGAFYDTTNSSGTVGYVLQSTGTSTRWVATSTLNLAGGSSSLWNQNGADVYYNAGSVGIGTTSPAAKLHVLDTTEQLRLAYNTSSYWTDTIASDGGRSIAGFGADGDLNFDFSGAADGDFSINSNDFFVDTSTGRIGIGTTSPQAQLHLQSATGQVIIEDTNSTVALTLRNGDTGIGDGDYLGSWSIQGLDSAGNVTSYVAPYGRAVTTTNGNERGDLEIWAMNNGAFGLRHTFTGSGDYYPTGSIGIGTTSPASLLDVYGDIRAGTSSQPTFFVDASTNRVGIGTSTPTANLHVYSTLNADLLVQGFSGSDYASVVRLAGENEDSWQGGYMQYDGSFNKFIIGVHDASDKATSSDTEVLVIDRSTAYLGVGTTSPTNKLTVRGNTFTGGLTATGSVTFRSLNNGGFLTTDANGVLSTTTVSLTTDITGTLAVSSGGTGVTSLTGILVGNGTSAFTASSSIADSYLDNNLTIDANGSVDSTALTDGGTITFDWVDDEVADSLTVSGGTINNTPIGETTSSTARFTTATSADQIILSSLTLSSITSGLLTTDNTGVVSASSTLSDSYISDDLTIGSNSIIADGLIVEADLDLNTATAGYVLQASSTASGGFAWVATSSLGIGGGAATLAALTDTNVTNVGTGDLLYYTGGTWATTTNLTYDGTNFGIGTTTPTGLLSVNGEIYLASTTPGQTTNSLYNLGGSLYFNGSAVGGGLWTQNGSDAYYNTGNIGIGTTSPSRKLTVTGESFFAGKVTASSSNLANWQSAFSATLHQNVSSANANSGVYGEAYLEGATDYAGELRGGDFEVWNYSTGTLTSAAGVFTYLDNTSGTTTNMIGVRVGSSNVSGGVVVNNYGLKVENVWAGTNDYAIHTSQNNGYAIYNSGAAQSYFAGSLGIGTTSPSSKLSIHAKAGDTNRLLFSVASSTPTATSTLFTVLNNGYVGIGTSSPSRLLTVDGDARFAGLLYDINNSAGTAGYVLQTTASGVRWVATSTLGLTAAQDEVLARSFTATETWNAITGLSATTTVGVTLDATDLVDGQLTLIIDGATSTTVYAGDKNYYVETATSSVSILAQNYPHTYVGATTTTGQTAGAQDVAFSATGDKMYIVADESTNRVYEYNLSSNWDVTTASFNASSSIPEDSRPFAFAFNNDGTKMFVLGDAAPEINEYTLSPAWDITSISFVDSTSISQISGSPHGLAFNQDGTKLFILGDGTDAVFEYTLTAFDASTISYVDSYTTSDEQTSSRGLTFNTDGTRMFISGGTDDEINEYTLSVGFDVSTASFTRRFDVGGQTTSPRGIYIATSSSKLYVTDSTNERIVEYDFDSPDYTGEANVTIVRGANTLNPSAFTGLTDTQSSLTANRVIFTNSGATALTDSADFVFDGTNFGIGSSSPSRNLTVVGTMAVNGLSAVAGTDQSVCIDPTTNEITTQAGDTCAVSSQRYKNSIESLPDTGLGQLNTLRPVSFLYNHDQTGAVYWGFIAEEAASTSPQLAYFNDDGTVQTINNTGILSLTVKSVQELDEKLEALISLGSASSTNQSFKDSFLAGLFIKIANWLGDAGNGLGNIFAESVDTGLVTSETVNTTKLCVDDLCITKDELQVLLDDSEVQVTPEATAGNDTEPAATSTTGGDGQGEIGSVPTSTSTEDSAVDNQESSNSETGIGTGNDGTDNTSTDEEVATEENTDAEASAEPPTDTEIAEELSGTPEPLVEESASGVEETI